ncbi:MAG: peptidoglycan bridge formation glycyltransferase FemA/FemB family protein [Anaerolineaceae bacterium]|nr:peptidoglycan bridge formation glycyltransferase FemA/FemB family protein [Anaerolineaceae bacterium]
MKYSIEEQWDAYLDKYPDAHLLQTSAWGELKEDFGWEAVPVHNDNCGALVLFRKLPFGFRIAYIPKGLVGTEWQTLWPELDALCRRKRAIFLKVEPDAAESQQESLQDAFTGFERDAKPIQPRQTILVSLEGEEEDWMARMKQKTRYNIRLAKRKGVRITETSDLSVFQDLMDTTGQRDGFGVHNQFYYQRVYDLFAPSGACAILLASYEEKPLAAMMVFARGSRAWYFYGASNNEERNRMPTYLLQWEAMRWAVAKGCSEYDLWGVPDAPEEELEASFTNRRDGLWGVYRFKRGFGGVLVRSAGAWDRVYQPLLYRLYLRYMQGRAS